MHVSLPTIALPIQTSTLYGAYFIAWRVVLGLVVLLCGVEPGYGRGGIVLLIAYISSTRKFQNISKPIYISKLDYPSRVLPI